LHDVDRSRHRNGLAAGALESDVANDRALADYAAERDELMRQLAGSLEAVGWVSAAWIRGSFGRGEADYVSDIDVHVAVDDRRFPSGEEERLKFVGSVRRPLLTQDAGWAPVGGFNWCVLYPANAGALEVDWMVWPASVAEIAPPAVVLFNRGAVPNSGFGDYRILQNPGPPRDPDIMWAHCQASVWLFIFIAVKYLVRGADDAVFRMVELADAQLAQLRVLLGRDARPASRRRSAKASLRALVEAARELAPDRARVEAPDLWESADAVIATCHRLLPSALDSR